MANLSRIKTWNSGEILTHTDLNAEFQNILDNASTLVSTITALTISNDPGVLIISNSDVSINDDDQIGRIDFRAYVGDGTGSGSTHNINARIHVVADDVTGATEDATVTFQGIVAGTLTTMFSYGANIMTIQPDLEAASAILRLVSDQNDDAGDGWEFKVANGGVLTLGNDIASAGSYVAHLTFTPHATVTSSTAAFGGIVTANAFEGNITGNVTGNASGTALTVTQAAQTAITSVGTLTGLALSGTFTQDKGADVASTAGVMTLGADGNYFDITGTNSITGIATLGVGTFVTLHFDAAATLVHHSTDLIMPGAANVVCAAGDEFTFVEFDTADWRCVSYALASGQAIVGGVGVKGADVASTAGVMTLGDGTYFDITGTNSITGIATLGIGKEVTLHFDAAAVLVHDATNFVLPGGANITCAANDEFTFVEYASADWRCVSYALASGLAIGGGNSTTDGLYEHSFTIAGAYTITTGNNALSAGPITIGYSGSVTIPATSTWVIA